MRTTNRPQNFTTTTGPSNTDALQQFITIVTSSIERHAQTDQELGAAWQWDQGLTTTSTTTHQGVFTPAERSSMLTALQNDEDKCIEWQMIKQSCIAQMTNIMEIIQEQPEFLNQIPNSLLNVSPDISDIVPMLRIILAKDYELNSQLPGSLRNTTPTSRGGQPCFSINLSPESSSALPGSSDRRCRVHLDPSNDRLYAATLCKILSNKRFPSTPTNAAGNENNIPGVRLGSILSNTIEPLGIESIDALLSEKFPILMTIQKATRDLQNAVNPDLVFASNPRNQLNSIQGKIRTVNHVLPWIMTSIADEPQPGSLDPRITKEDAVGMLSEILPVLKNIKDDLTRLWEQSEAEQDPQRAEEGALSMMIGGSEDLYLQHRSLFNTLANKVFYCGGLGSGHALKGLNNYVSAAGLIASCEALIVAEKFGILPDLFIDVLNHSTGKNDATENKLKRFVTSKTFNSGFSLNLQAKDVDNAVVFSEKLGLELSGLSKFSEILNSAKCYFDSEVDHTEIYKFLKNQIER